MRDSIIKVAVVHDWLTGMRGGEDVLESILELFPEADLFTLLHNRGSCSETIENRKIVTSFIDRLPLKKSKYRHYLPLFPAAIELLDLKGYDLVISSSHCVARGVIVPPDVPHISFIHSPMRYVWDMYQDYFPPRGFINRFIIPFFANRLRIWDTAAAPRSDLFISNSSFVAGRIRRYYGRDAVVVHPPCIRHPLKSIEKRNQEDYYLVLSALVPYKRIDLAIDAFRDFGGRKLVIAGSGPELEKLKASAPPEVQFLGFVSDGDLASLFKRSKGLIFPGLEDFGIVPVQAQSYGCPVIAYGRGGALETIVDGKTGVFFPDQTVQSLREAVIRSEGISYKPNDFIKNVNRFTDQIFKDGIIQTVRKSLKIHNKKESDFFLKERLGGKF